ncbi:MULTISPECIES: M16 family metallopeptidase [Providencia]|uniref:M16 family metallopeptidase n=1 Tax=Providencia TaxID=586 RepID=UPI000837F496|nr:MULTISPECIES: insulinase family protein [Providencia]MBP6122177.1 insulinase family protein [Providencia sp.]NIH21334.1 insulinase family protein [Providencia heimbachae]
MHRKITLATFIGLLLVGCAGSVSQNNNTPALLPVRSDIQHYQLDNGLQVYLLQRNQPGVELRLLVNSGSLQENEQQLGLAHFTEHMAFKGTKHFPGTTGFKQLEQQGLKLGSHVNAITSLNSTLYKLSLPDATTAQVTTSLQVMADWASNMTFDQDAFEKERPVIVEEWRLRQGMGYRINDSLEKLRYHGSRYVNRNPIGSLDIVRQAPIEQAKDYYQTWYQPQRMSLIIIGDFNTSSVRNQVDTLFALPKPEKIAQDDPQWKSFAGSTNMLVQPVFDKEQGARYVQFSLQKDVRAPLNTRLGQSDDLMDSLWLAILNQRFSVMVDNGLIPSISINEQGAMLDNQRLQQLMIIHPKGNDYAGATQILFTELQRLATEPVTQEELDSAKQAMLKKLSQQAASEQRYSNEYLAGQLTTALEYEMPMWNKRQQLDNSYQLIKDVKPQNLQQHVAAFLQTASPRLALIGPDTDAAAIDSKTFNAQWQRIRQSSPGSFTLRSQAIQLQLPQTAKGSITDQAALPVEKTERWTLSNGIQVIVKADKNLKEDIQFNLQLPGGRSLETAQTSGLTDWALKLPESSGYGQYSARDLALLAKQNQISLRPYSELLTHGYRGKTPIDNLETALQLLNLKLTAPQFSGEKLEQQKQSFALNLAKVPVERTFLDNINQESYTHGEMLVINPQGGWNQFTAQQLQQANRQLLSSTADMTLVISGAMNSRELKPLLEQWVASIPASNQKLTWRDQGIMPKMASFNKRYPISSSDKSMVSMQFAAPAQWSQQDQLTMQLIDTIVSQRLRSELREKASGIYALGFSQMLAKKPQPYYFARLNFTTSPERAEEMIKIAQATIEKIRQSGINEKELNEAKNIWLTENSQVTDSSGYWTEALAQIAADDGQYQRLNQEQGIIRQLTVNDVNRLALQYLGQNSKVFMMTP